MIKRSIGRRVVLYIAVVVVVVLTTRKVLRALPDRPRFNADAAQLERLAAAAVVPNHEPAEPAGWPQWRGPRRDGSAGAGPPLLTKWPARGPALVWEIGGGEGYSSFAVGGGRVFTQVSDGNNEAVLCLDAEDGKERWRHRYPSAFTDKSFPGPRATPALDGDRLYATGAGGMFFCLQAETGEKLWEYDLLAEFGATNRQWGVSCSPLVEGGLVLANPGGPDGNSVAAFDKKTGELVWKALDDSPGYSSPVAATIGGVRQVLFFTGRGPVALTPAEGKELWRYPWQNEFEVNAATPVVFQTRDGDRVDDYVFISSGYGKGCVLLHVRGDETAGFAAEPVYEGNQLCSHFASPVLVGSYLYGFNESTLTCLDARTGAVCWKQGGFGKGSLLQAEGYLIVLGERGKLALVEANAEAYKEAALCQPLKTRSWAMPALADGRLYLRDEEKIVCLDLRRPRTGAGTGWPQ